MGYEKNRRIFSEVWLRRGKDKTTARSQVGQKGHGRVLAI